MVDKHDREILKKLLAFDDLEDGTNNASESLDVMIKLGDILHQFTPAERQVIFKVMLKEIEPEELSQDQLEFMARLDRKGGFELFKDFLRLSKGS